MPRGERKSVDIQIAEIESKKSQFQIKIDTYKAKVAELDAQIKDIQESQKQKELENLLQVIKASGKTPDEVMAALNL
jgi:septal ring factor EnvC (AmiA/AmiB activator)